MMRAGWHVIVRLFGRREPVVEPDFKAWLQSCREWGESVRRRDA